MKINLFNDITIQKDAIVSKTILKNNGGTVTLFAFDSQQSLSKHSTPFDALFQCVDGKFIITIENDVHILSKDDLIMLPANISHSVDAELPSKCLLTMIKMNK